MNPVGYVPSDQVLNYGPNDHRRSNDIVNTLQEDKSQVSKFAFLRNT